MKFAIVVSRKDEAGMNIAIFISESNNIKKYFVDCDIVDAEGVDVKLDIKEDFVIFVSKHEGKSEKILACHAPGNWKGAGLGGVGGKVCKTSGNFLKIIFNELNENLFDNWKATMEVTHHGPLVEKPCVFVEIGSNERNWKDKEAGKAVASSIIKSINKFNNLKNTWEVVIAVGGPHYCPNFNKIQFGSKYGVGHVIPQYCLPLTAEMVREAVAKTVEPVKKAIIDWKGCGVSEEREKVVALLKSEGLEVLRTDKISK